MSEMPKFIKGVFGWRELRWKEREGKEIGWKKINLCYLVEMKIWEKKVEQCIFVCGVHVNSGLFSPP